MCCADTSSSRYQLIRAICEDSCDKTKVSLVYANRSQADVIMQDQLDRFAQGSGGKFKVYHTLDKPPPGWKQGIGHVDEQMIKEHLPAASDGKPGTIAARKAHAC